jgi:hypothetical protein
LNPGRLGEIFHKDEQMGLPSEIFQDNRVVNSLQVQPVAARNDGNSINNQQHVGMVLLPDNLDLDPFGSLELSSGVAIELSEFGSICKFFTFMSQSFTLFDEADSSVLFTMVCLSELSAA